MIVIAVEAHGRFELAEDFTGRAQFTILQAEIEAGNYLNAAPRLEWMMQTHRAELMRMEDGRLMSLEAWLAALPETHRQGLRRSSGQLEGPPRRRLEQLRTAAEKRPEPWHELAARYPFSEVAPPALVAAAGRAFELGDLSSAAALYELARQAGWTASPPEAELIERLEPFRRLPLSLSAEQPWHDAVPYAARWWGNVDAVTIWRFMPYASTIQPDPASPRTLELTYISGARRLVAFRPNGIPHWRWEAARPWLQQTAAPRTLDLARGLVWSIQPVVDESGAAQVLIVRQLRSVNAEGCLRAFRAADGRLLWSTEHDEAMKDLLIVSEPAVAGRYAYVVAVDSADKGENLVLAAVDVMTGRLAWTSVIGRGASVQERRDGNHPLEMFWQQTAPAVDERHVYISPNVGRVVAVGRFDGRVRWSAAYPVSTRLPRREEWRQYREHRLSGRAARPPMSPQQMLRWHNTPAVGGRAVVFAPPDAAGEFALDRLSGRVLWQTAGEEAPVLMGESAGHAIFAGRQILARDSQTGDAIWTYQPSAAQIAGPPVLRGVWIYVPLNDGSVIRLAAGDGRVAHDVKIPDFRRIVAAVPARAILEEMEALSSFGPSEP